MPSTNTVARRCTLLRTNASRTSAWHCLQVCRPPAILSLKLLLTHSGPCTGTAGASLDVKDKHDCSPLFFARRAAATATGQRQRDSLRTVKVLEDASRTTQRWFRAVHAPNADLAELERMLAAGQRLEARRSGRTALHDAARGGRDATVAWLLERGADPRSRTTQGGHTPLHLATDAWTSFLPQATTCIVTANGVLALHDTVLALLAHGAPPLARNGQGRTPLAEARAVLSRRPAAARAAEKHAADRKMLPLLTRLERAEHLRRRWRLFVRVAGCLAPWHARARERAYAPGGLGFDEARASFEERARKAPRWS